MRTTALTAVVCTAVLVTSVFSGAAASAGARPAEPLDGTVTDLPIARANPDVAPEVIAELPEVVQQSTVTIEGYVPGSPIVYPDGTPVEGQSPEATRAAEAAVTTADGGISPLANCRLQVWSAGAFWGPTSVCGVAVFGSPGYRRGYSWSAAAGTATTGCVQGRGFNASQQATWYGLGCGSFGGGQVNWGNVLGNPAARAMSQGAVVGFRADWSS